MSYSSLMNSKLRNINNVIRYSGFRLLQPETVDAHSMDMLVLGLLILDDLPEFLDRKDLIYRIAIHDLEESCSCDIPRSLKYFDNKIHKEIERVTKELVRLEVSQTLFKDLTNAKDLTILEGRVVKFLDILQCCFILKKEVIYLGNKVLSEVYLEACNYLEKSVIKESLFGNDDSKVNNYFTNITRTFLCDKDN